MSADFTSVAPTAGDRWAPSRRYWVVVLVVAVAALVVVVPVLPAAWRGITHPVMLGGAPERGMVQVQSCSRDTLFFTWTCRGRFQVDDPEAQPYPPMDDVAVVNDTQQHPQGTLEKAAKDVASHDAYLWGAGEQARTFALWAWVLFFLTVTAGAVARLKAGI